MRFRRDDLGRRLVARGIDDADALDAGFHETDFDFRHVRPRPAERVPDNDGHAVPARVDPGGNGFPIAVDRFLGLALRRLVTADGVVIHVVGHHARRQVVRLVEQDRFPSWPERRRVGRSAEPLGHGGELFRREQPPLHGPDPLLEFDAAAVAALEDRIELAGHDHRFIAAFRNHRLVLRRHGQPQRERRVGSAIELLGQRRDVRFGWADINPRQPDPVGAPRERRELGEAFLAFLRELVGRGRQSVEVSVAERQPERGDPRPIQSLPHEFRRADCGAARRGRTTSSGSRRGGESAASARCGRRCRAPTRS